MLSVWRFRAFWGNFASGITILFFKPYWVGDWVQISDMFGKVEEIQIFNTMLVTPGNKTLIIPNGQVTDNIITNFSSKGEIRLELTVTMPYSESFPKVRDVIEDALRDFPLILDDPKPLIGIESFDSHSIVVSVRPYIIPDNYWDATFESLQRIKHAFHHTNIQVAFGRSGNGRHWRLIFLKNFSLGSFQYRIESSFLEFRLLCKE